MRGADFSADIAGENPAASWGAAYRVSPAAFLVDGFAVEGVLGALFQAQGTPGRTTFGSNDGIANQFYGYQDCAEPDHITIGFINEQGILAQYPKPGQVGRMLQGENSPTMFPVFIPVFVGFGRRDRNRRDTFLFQCRGQEKGNAV